MSRLRSQRGFALLLTLTLLAFIVLLLVGLATYTRVETAVAGNMQRQAQARENALLALDVALGQLQRHAGSDTRVTAAAESIAGVETTKRHYTGVWDAETTGAAPLAWLASGAETAAGVDITTAIPTARRVMILGNKTDGSSIANATYAELQDITAPGVPGQTGNSVIGRYAWWVGDEGVKAPVGAPQTAATIDYAPFVDGTATDGRARIAQQISLGAGATDGNGAAVFEPRDANNTPLVAGGKVAAANQLAFLRNASNTAIGLTTLRSNYHAWSPNNFAVIADTKRGGLRQDLSLNPTLLGNAFSRWANYSAYMEPTQPTAATDGEGVTPAPATAPAISPAYGNDPLRRRYAMTPHFVENDTGGSHQVGPVLTYFLLSFNVRTVNGSLAAQPLEVRGRWMISLWNPYTSALVPENLRIEITRLPRSVTAINDTPGRERAVGPSFSLQDVFGSPGTFGSPLRINLPWDGEPVPNGAPAEDRRSWLPGRVYTWRSRENITGGAPTAAGYDSDFYSRTLDDGGAGVIRPLEVGTVDGGDDFHLEIGGSDTLLITLYAVRESGDVRLGAFTSPAFLENFITSPQKASQSGYQFSYVFRLAESIDTPDAPGTWLTTTFRDLRHRTLRSESFVVGENGNDPAQYGDSYKRISNPDRLLDRAENGWSFNEDVPVFELPRAPLLSLGALQHFRLIAQRPFMIGNPWGVGATLNDIPVGQLFDRFFFSGLVDGVTPSTATNGDLILPNPLMKPLRKQNQAKVTVDDIRALMNPPATTTEDGTVVPAGPASAASSKFFLQGGAFNVNSADPQAWAAVLRGVRFPAPLSFTYLDASPDTGTADDTAVASVQSSDAQFFRFSQSAQETYKADAGMAETNSSAPSAARTELFRRGMRTLTATQVKELAGKIAEFVRMKHASTDEALGGPFRSLEEFLSPSTLFAGATVDGGASAPRSVLEAAIADAGVNVDESGSPIEFSSQFLTQADIMTALAPVLFPRSDTFVIRTHGQAINPATGAIEGRAWCEATVQRLPEYVEAAADDAAVLPADLTSEVNKLNGRRFKIVSFRWLTLSDI